MSGQELYFYNLGVQNNTEGFIYNEEAGIVRTNCHPTFMNGAYYPDGIFRFFDFSSNPNNDGKQAYYSLDIENCTREKLFDLESPDGANTSLIHYVDHLGRWYFGISNRDGTHAVARFTNIQEGIYEKVFNHADTLKLQDITATKDFIYLFFIGNNEVFKLDHEFNLISTFFTPIPIISVSTVGISCDSSITYALGSDRQLDGHVVTNFRVGPHYLYQTIGPLEKKLVLFKYDLELNAVEKIDEVESNDLVSLAVLTSPSEFRASDPNCDLLVDLDYDNSSGVYPYDFDIDGVLCTTSSATLVDEDVYVHSSLGVDSILIILEGNVDGDLEEVLFGGVSGFEWESLGNYQYMLIGRNKSDQAYEEALKQISYLHNGSGRSGGIRTVTFLPYGPGATGQTAKATLYVSSVANSGDDVELTICDELMVDTLSVLLNGDGLGRWEPSLVDGESFNSEIDLLDQYAYVSGDSVCGMDTAFVFIEREGMPLVDLGPDVEICRGISTSLNLDLEDGETVVWEDGSVSQNRMVSEFGSYIAEVTNGAGCVAFDTIVLSSQYQEYTMEVGLCGETYYLYKGNDYGLGLHRVDTLLGIGECDTVLFLDIKSSDVSERSIQLLVCGEDGISYQDTILYAGETWDYTISQAEGCDSVIHVSVDSIPKPRPEILGDAIICFGLEADLSSTPHLEYQWSNGSKERTVNVGPGLLNLMVRDSLNCYGQTSVVVVERPEWTIDLDPTIEVDGYSIYDLIFSSNGSSPVSISVEPIDGLEWIGGENLQIDAEASAIYRLIFTDEIGCIVEKEIEVIVREARSNPSIANTFSPGSSTPQNRLWQVDLEPGTTLLSMSIYDRWGNRVAFSDAAIRWDGRSNNQNVAQGVYAYFIEVEVRGKREIWVGDLTVVD